MKKGVHTSSSQRQSPTILQRKLNRALSNPGAVLDFYRAFLEQVVFVIVSLHSKGTVSLLSFETDDGKIIFPVFINRTVCRTLKGSGKCFPIKGRELVKQIARYNKTLVINPGAKQTFMLNELLVKALAEGSTFHVDEESFNGSFYSGALGTPMGRLKALLRSVLRKYDNVDAAYMTVMYEPLSAYPPHPVVGLVGRGAFETVANACRDIVQRESSEHVWFYPLGNDSLSIYARQNSIPFYWKNEPIPKHPPTMTREKLLTFVQQIPDVPVNVSGFMKAYLRSNSASEEAREMWKTLDFSEKQRFANFESYLAFYKRQKEVEIQNYRHASTHRKAKKMLLKVLRKKSEFCLYLRSFSTEATEMLEPISGTRLAGVRWLSFYDRSTDQVLHKLSKYSKIEIVGLANSRDQLSRLSTIPQLEIGNDDWLRLMVSLVARAKIIFVNAEELGRGLFEELMAIQRHSREDNCAIVIPDKKRAENWLNLKTDVLVAHGIDYMAPKGLDQPVLKRMLATFGYVFDWDELAKISRYRAKLFTT